MIDTYLIVPERGQLEIIWLPIDSDYYKLNYGQRPHLSRRLD